MKRYLFADAVAAAAVVTAEWKEGGEGALNYVNCKASRSGIVQSSMQKSQQRQRQQKQQLPFYICVGSFWGRKYIRILSILSTYTHGWGG